MTTKYWEVQTEESVIQGLKGMVLAGDDLLTVAQNFTRLTRKSASPAAKNIIAIHQVKFDSTTGDYIRLGIKSREQSHE